MTTTNSLQYSLSVTPTLNGAAQPAVAVTSGQSTDQLNLPVGAVTLAPLASQTFHAPAGAQGGGVFGDGRFSIRIGAGPTLALTRFPQVDNPDQPYQVGAFLACLIGTMTVINNDPDDDVELMVIGLA